MRPVRVFVAESGNAFMADIAGWIVEAARLAGRTAELSNAGLPRRDGSLNLVVAPHEFFVLNPCSHAELEAAARCSIPICTEQPGTPWYRLALAYCQRAPIAFDINPHGVAALIADGIDASHLRLGGVPSMDHRGGRRDIDVLYLAGHTDRRGAELARLAPILWEHRSELRIFRTSSPISGGTPGVVFGEDKYDLLARSRILLNIHRDDNKPGYFEWARMVEAMANGCAVVTEPSTGYQPLEPGRHFIETDDLGATLVDLLEDDQRCQRVGRAAASAVLDEYALHTSLTGLLDRADEAADRTVKLPRWFTLRPTQPLIRAHRRPLMNPLRPADQLRRRTYRAILAEQQFQRRIERARCQLAHGVEDYVERIESESYATARPEVSVIVTLFNYAGVVSETLDSIVASRDVDLEIVLVDDHSTDNGRDVVRQFIADHPTIPIVLLASDVNRGLAQARNLAVANVRGSKVMVLDADNLVYPNCLRRLADTLEQHPDASFTYATLEDFGVERGVRSAMAWHLPWLCERNYIDAQAMIRAATFERHGGYRREEELGYGWEDWEFWLRLGAAGEHGVHLPEMLGRYRTQPSSMITITNLAESEIRSTVMNLYPELPWPTT
jgi:hypothetical protein